MVNYCIHVAVLSWPQKGEALKYVHVIHVKKLKQSIIY